MIAGAQENLSRFKNYARGDRANCRPRTTRSDECQLVKKARVHPCTSHPSNDESRCQQFFSIQGKEKKIQRYQPADGSATVLELRRRIRYFYSIEAEFF
jgi:hypothetical protein